MIAYFDCFSGVSGDMCLGAFLHLGVPAGWLEQQLRAMPLNDFSLKTEQGARHGISGIKAHVIADTDAPARDYKVIRDLIQNGSLPDAVKENSLAVFARLARAESKIHNRPVDHVHFHEVGGTDAIADIVGTMLCLDYLKISRVACSALPLGSGFVKCAHGTLPVPAPATVELLKGAPSYGTEVKAELVTPTGAAIVSTLAKNFGPAPAMKIQSVGYGLGTKDLKEQPNCLRILLGEPQKHLEKDTVLVVETSIDDMNPEFFGFVRERLFEDGALDVAWIPAHMKKGRPGVIVQVLCPPDKKDAVINRILTETTSIGVRYVEARREKLHREEVFVETSLGKMRAKRVTGPDGEARIIPEYEECKCIAQEKNISLKCVYEAVFGRIPERTGKTP